MNRLLLTGLLLAAGFSNAASITVIINNLQNKTGQVLIGLFNQKDTFPIRGKEYKGNIIYPITSPSITTIFDNIPPGTYAIGVIHDENRSGNLDKNLFGIPIEQYGFSNNIYGRFGPPSFESASFIVNKNMQIIIDLK